MANPNLDVLFIIFVAITGLAVSLQAGVLLALFLMVRKALTSMRERSEGLESKLLPVLEHSHNFLSAGQELVTSTRDLIAKLDPRLQSAAADLEVISKDIHAQVTR